MNRGETMYKIVGGSWQLQWGCHLALLQLSLQVSTEAGWSV